MIGFDRVKPLILQRVGAHLVGKADAASLLVKVQKNARPFGPHLSESGTKLRPAIAFE